MSVPYALGVALRRHVLDTSQYCHDDREYDRKREQVVESTTQIKLVDVLYAHPDIVRGLYKAGRAQPGRRHARQQSQYRCRKVGSKCAKTHRNSSVANRLVQ